ncbi:sugar ABC transporter permease [Paenibacillus athensensis]|uniref:ABC transporter permease n=1 Tax=Paenibacillus athensensis TaxID=1967502 RepID=A0A4Y8PY70_9BACL|nr:sugar ABC transporter permease [Paenibacillus athensensis]MCD1259643.1 sugar ABC transporter permease [Paenibacillus athensensis]
MTSRTGKQAAVLLAFVFPALLFYAVFVLAPAIGGVGYSLTNWNGLNPSYQFVGAANYVEALTDDPYFLNAVGFTLKYVAAMVILQNALAIALAVLVESRRRSKAWYRTIFFMPNMISLIIGGFMWLYIFTKVLPYMAEHSVLKMLDQSWIGDARFSFLAILIVSLWGGVGYLMVIYMAALQGVPAQLKEAAAIDGANGWQTFRHITLPMIYPALTIGVFLTLSSSFKAFDAVYALTGGGPGRATQVIALNIFEEAFKSSNRYGYANAKAVILFAAVLVITLIQLWIMKRREVES